MTRTLLSANPSRGARTRRRAMALRPELIAPLPSVVESGDESEGRYEVTCSVAGARMAHISSASGVPMKAGWTSSQSGNRPLGRQQRA
jgi:hypothetical protein